MESGKKKLTINHKGVLDKLSLLSKSTTTLVSNSTINALILRSRHMLSPSLIAYNSVTRLVMWPMFLEKALIQASLSARRIIPSPAFPVGMAI